MVFWCGVDDNILVVDNRVIISTINDNSVSVLSVMLYEAVCVQHNKLKLAANTANAVDSWWQHSTELRKQQGFVFIAPSPPTLPTSSPSPIFCLPNKLLKKEKSMY